MTFWSICCQNTWPDDGTKKLNELWIYNSHQGEITNEYFKYLYDLYDLGYWFESIKFFDYDSTTHKSLGADVYTIGKFCRDRFDKHDRILLLKSDCVLSVNYFQTLLSIPINQNPIYFTAPFICAKERAGDSDIAHYSIRTEYIPSDDITFFVEDQTNSSDNDFNNRPGINVTDKQILFTSCYVVTDFSCHFLSVCLFDYITIDLQSWGGAKFHNLLPYLVITDKCFVIHKYHDIISENRSTTREGPVETWLKS